MRCLTVPLLIIMSLALGFLVGLAMPVSYTPKPIKAEVNNYVPPARLPGVVYQNTDLRPRLILLTCTQNCPLGVGDAVVVYGFVGPATPPVWIASYCGIGDTNDKVGHSGNIVMIVPPGYYYRITVVLLGAATNSIDSWTEIEL